MIVTRPSESMHWYTSDGEPKYTVEAKDGSQRPTTLRDARKLGLVPSVTTIIKTAANPGLEAWKLQQMMLAALTLPRADDEPEESFLQRVMIDSKEHARKAADLGSEIHAGLEGFFETGILTNNYAEYQAGVEGSVHKLFGELNWSVEKAFAHPEGFGGKVDLHSRDGDGVVIDFKTKQFTKDTIDKVVGYDEHCMQLAAYRAGLNLPKARCANVFVSVTEPGLVKIHEWTEEDLERAETMFSALLSYWYAKSRL
jgi:hypothetical protein